MAKEGRFEVAEVPMIFARQLYFDGIFLKTIKEFGPRGDWF